MTRERSEGQTPAFLLRLVFKWRLNAHPEKCHSRNSDTWKSNWAGWPLKTLQSINYDQVPSSQDIRLLQPKNKCCSISSKLIFNQKSQNPAYTPSPKKRQQRKSDRNLGATMLLGHKSFELSPHMCMPPSSPFSTW